MAEQRMLDKLKALEIHYEDVQSRLADPAVYADRETLRSLSREEKELSPPPNRIVRRAPGKRSLRPFQT